MKINKIFAFFILFSTIILLAFQLPDSIKQTFIPEIVKQRIDEDVSTYYAERLRICKLDALTKAEDFVDSIIVNKISLTVLKGIRFPDRPARPQSPTEIKLDDTTRIVPILK